VFGGNWMELESGEFRETPTDFSIVPGHYLLGQQHTQWHSLHCSMWCLICLCLTPPPVIWIGQQKVLPCPPDFVQRHNIALIGQQHLQ
jgi:hypothetical protein